FYTPSEPEALLCGPPPNPDAETVTCADGTSSEDELLCRAEVPSTGSAPRPAAGRRDIDYVTLSGGAGAIVGGNLSLTLDRDGHLYFGVAGGVGLSATVVSASAVAGQMTTSGAP